MNNYTRGISPPSIIYFLILDFLFTLISFLISITERKIAKKMVHSIQTEEEFISKEANIINSKKTAVVYFCADWCASCKTMGELIENQSNSLPDYDWLKVNIANTPNIVKKYSIKSLPSLLLFKKGELFNKLHSSVNKNTLVEKLLALGGN